MYDERVRAIAREAMASGASLNAISKRLGVSRSALREWRDKPEPLSDDNKYPRLVEEVAAIIASVHPSRPVHRAQAVGYVSVVSYWKHWPCLFP